MKKDNVKFLAGPHELTTERIDWYIQKYSEQYENVEIKRYYGAEFNPENFVNELVARSLFNEHRIVIVHQMELIEKKVWGEYIFPHLEKIVNDVLVIFEGLNIKVKPVDYEIETVQDAENLFRKIYQKSWKKNLTARDICEISKFLKTHPYEFSTVIGVIEKHLENLVMQKEINEQTFLSKLQNLLEIDFKLKSGRIPNEPGWEILLLRLLDISS
ncbi:MAG: hypothetical protein ACPL3Q_04310 [Candidatus Ratteibacteria bacterium]